MKKRLFAAFVCLCIIVSQLPTITFAEAGVQDSCVITGTSGLCEHHTKHDESCGYTEGTAEIPCSHEHTESCGGLTDPTACNHTHDEACSYVPATEGSPCTFVCEVCNAQNSDDQEVPSDPQPEKCSCETLCTEEEVNTGCPICSADHISCTGEAPVFQTPVCTCTNKCSEGTMKTDCSVCSADGVDLSVCKGTVSMLLSVSRNVENIPYLDENGRQQTAASAKTITDQDTVWDGGTEEAWYVVDSNVTIGSRIIVTGTVHLILADGYTLTASQGIQVAEGNSLIIYAQSTGEKMGALTVKTQSYNPNAGIGGSDGQDGGTVTINGGTVNVSSYYGAGIGGGKNGSGGTVTINNGIVNASSDYSGAGIGGGEKGSGGTVTINGGIINARNDHSGAGIGGGENGSGSTVNINGGMINAIGGIGAGIGGGWYGSGGTVTINDGTVNASSNYGGAGIGNGRDDTNGGSFSTGTNGTAFITASGSPAIYDQNSKDSWLGVIVENGTGQVYGNQTLDNDCTMSAGNTLTIPQGISFTIPSGVTLNNEGILTNEGSLINESTIINGGTLTNEGTLSNESTIINGGTLVNRGTFTNEGDLTNQNTLINQSTFQNMGKLTNDATMILEKIITGGGVIDGKGQTIGQGNSVSYRDEDGQMQTCSDYTCISTDTTVWNDGWYVSAGTVNVGGRITVNGTVHLILDDGCTLTASQGIQVAEGDSLIIYSKSNGEKMGVLTATAYNSDAAIGGSNGQNGGAITIFSGTVNASGKDGAGIGGGENGSGGTVTINGGTVNATGYMGAGIGGGDYGSGGTITINGGTVNVDGDSGAGIGVGNEGSGETTTVTINNGTINANGGLGAGIGGGSWYGSGGTIIINGGTVNATATSGAGIGGGIWGSGGNVTISGGTVTATSYMGAGIGGGEKGSGGNVTITGGTVTARSKESGAGIGGGIEGSGGTITITGGTVNATADSSGAGIGGSGGTVTISGGTIDASSYYGAGIGGSVGQDGGTTTVIISGGTIDASSYYGAGIGGGDYGYDGTVTITITGGTVTAKSIDDDSIGKGVNSTLSCTLTIGPVMGGQITAKAGGSEDDAQPLIGSPFQNETQAIEQVTGKKYFHSEMQKFTTITAQPQSVTVTEGGTATFEVAADGTGTLTYQWQQSTDNGTSWTNINGANAASYTTSATTIDMNGYQYRCMVTGDLGNATSAVVSLTVKHNLVKVGAKAATCTENGNLEYWYCEKCDKYFKDENGATPTTFEETVIKATGHSYENGKCTVCGAKDPNYVKPTENAKSPQTGENNSISLLLIFALISTVVFMIGKKQKTQKK